ncbi:MAG: UDP-N-acetylmuramate dehydrogenase [Solirubrobacteraceae bacterium]
MRRPAADPGPLARRRTAARAAVIITPVSDRENVPLAPLTTLGLGGPARRLVEAWVPTHAVEEVRRADREGEPLLILAGGSNVVIADSGFPGTVLHLMFSGFDARYSRSGTPRTGSKRVELRVAAGHPWDEVVEWAVDEGIAGVECLSGIPGSCGATPIQNVGAYGQEIAETVVSVSAYDRVLGEIVDLAPAECGFGYRTSVFKRTSRYLVLEVTIALSVGESAPIRYPELARELGLDVGDTVSPIAPVRDAVLTLRGEKGMLVRDDDPDAASAGSFFTNPVLSEAEFAALERRAAEHEPSDGPPRFPAGEGRVKTSAAWLIEHAGFGRGYGEGAIGLSSKHPLAIVNRGGGTTAELVELARTLRDGVRERFGVELVPEPVLVGAEL